MGKGPDWTVEEEDRIRAIEEDNPDTSAAKIAELAFKYGSCGERNLNGIRQHIIKMRKPKQSEPKNTDDIQLDIDVVFYKGLYNSISKKYASLLDAILGNAVFFGNTKNLKLDYYAIIAWLWGNEPEKVKARRAELEEDANETD